MPKIKIKYNRPKEEYTVYYFNPLAITLVAICINVFSFIVLPIYGTQGYDIYVYLKIIIWITSSILVWIISLPVFLMLFALAKIDGGARINFTHQTLQSFNALVYTNFVFAVVVWILYGVANIIWYLTGHIEIIKAIIVFFVMLSILVLLIREK